MLIAFLALQVATAQPHAPKPSDARAPAEIVAAAPAADWRPIPPGDLLVMDLAPDAEHRARRVVIGLLPAPLSQGWIGNIRKLAAAHWWDGTSVNRVQDNYVAQWGDPNGEDKAKAKRLPTDLARVPQSEYTHPTGELESFRYHQGEMWGSPPAASPSFDPAPMFRGVGPWETDSFYKGFAVSSVLSPHGGGVWPIHCYGMVGVGRDMPPDTGTGAALYTVIGQAPRHLDRNIALVGRVIEGIEHLSSLPRGTGALGFYKTATERTPIVRIRLGTDLPARDQPRFEYLATDSASFAAYTEARANRRDTFFIQRAYGADICNVPVPVRRVGAK